jgi:GNAT superfamily N-acetyltransferase
MEYREIAHATREYDAACALRDTVLRVPIGLRLSDKDVAGEEAQRHFVAVDATGAVLATVLFKPLTPTHAKLRQMAVDASLHGKGIGRELVLFAERILAANGYRSIEANARDYAIGFYEKLGYRTVGDFFEEVGLPTLRIEKTLA